MSLQYFILRFGYAALVVGLLFEGETILVLAAFLAHRGYLDLPLVLVIGFLVTFASDQFFFWMGHEKGNAFLASRPSWKPSVDRVKSLLNRNANLLFLGFRFMYGLRTVMPLVFGMNKFEPRRFFAMNLMGALIWTLVFGMAGYLFGQIAEVILVDVDRYELWIAAGILVVGAGVWLYRRFTKDHTIIR